MSKPPVRRAPFREPPGWPRAGVPAVLVRRVTRGWPPAAFAVRSLIGLVALLGAGAAFALLLALVEAEWRALAAADKAVVDVVNSAVGSSGALVTTAKALSWLGSPLAVALIVVVPVLWLLIRGLPRLAAFVAVTGLGAAVLGPGVKALVERARPVVEVPLSSPTGDSFPSGHAVAVTIGWGALLLVFLPVVPPRARRAAVMAAIAVIVGVGLTRVALGVHYASDVVAGWLLGVVWLGITATAFRTSREHGELARPRPGVNPLPPPDRRALQPAPAHDPPLPEGATTAAKLLVAAVLLAGAVIGAGLLVTGPLEWVRRIDAEILGWLAGTRSDTLTSIATTVGWLGGVAGNVAVLLAVVPLASAITRRWRPALFLLVAAAGQGLIYLTSSRLVGRDRPGPEHADMLAVVSFPSGHVGAAVATYGGIAVLVLAWWEARARHGAVALAVLVVLGVAFSRLYKGVHYPSDVVAGVAYGLTWLTLCWTWLRPGPGLDRGHREDGTGSEPLTPPGGPR